MKTENLYRLNIKPPHVLYLILLSAFAAMGAILMTPGLPQIAAYFHVSHGAAQLTVTSFLLGYAIGQLIYGPIANRLGRKPAFYIGIMIATLGSLFSILSSPIESFDLLIIGRLFEAIGSSAGLVICFTIINDFYYPEQSRKIVGMMMLAFAIMPGIATAAGGFLTEYFRWQSCFYFLLLYGLALIYPASHLPETLIKADPFALQYRYLVKNYFRMLRNRKMMCYAMISGLSSACVYVYGTEGPFIGVHYLSLLPAEYGLMSLLPFLGTLLGSIITIYFSKFSAPKLLHTAFALETLGTLLLFFFFLFHWVTLASLFIPIGILFIGHAILASNALTLACMQTDDKANGSAVMNFASCAMPVLLTFLLGVFHVSSAIILPLLFAVALLSMLMIYHFGLRDQLEEIS